MQALNHVSLSFNGRQILDEVSLTLEAQKINSLLGQSGCGKSTILRLISGLTVPHKGHMHIAPQHCSMVFQEPRLLPWLTVEENLRLALVGISKEVQQYEITQALKQMHLQNTAHLMPSELSGGMAQRVGIARALLKKPQILLMDEPFSALDAITRQELQSMLVNLINSQPVTCVFVTHDIDEALRISKQIFLMKDAKTFLSFNNSSTQQAHIKQTILNHLKNNQGLHND